MIYPEIFMLVLDLQRIDYRVQGVCCDFFYSLFEFFLEFWN
jgi:hypothetical protein